MFRRNGPRAQEKAAAHPGAGEGYGHRSFSLGRWIRLYGVDLITMAAMGAIGLGVYMAKPAPSRSFPVYYDSGEIVYPQFAYPLRKEIIPIWLAALIAFIVPFFFFCLFQARRRSIEDLLCTTMGLLMSLITAAVFQVFIKWLIGGLRPHFLAVCKPNVPTSGAQRGNGFEMVMYDRSVCTGDEKQINDSLESMPSGHSTAGFAGLIYLSLYLNAQLKAANDMLPFTREGGWGWDSFEGVNGAPFDASANGGAGGAGRGMGMGNGAGNAMGTRYGGGPAGRV
ncbi:hypothetical protein FRC07_011633 [Ceratobasidium sp. 392]|nr:hypothetical protein FRC07_011633 [Ceratobasidium sp. 392]